MAAASSPKTFTTILKTSPALFCLFPRKLRRTSLRPKPIKCPSLCAWPTNLARSSRLSNLSPATASTSKKSKAGQFMAGPLNISFLSTSKHLRPPNFKPHSPKPAKPPASCASSGSTLPRPASRSALRAAVLLMNQKPPHGKRRKKQAEQYVSGVRAVLGDVERFHDRQAGHQNHQDQIQSLIHVLLLPPSNIPRVAAPNTPVSPCADPLTCSIGQCAPKLSFLSR